MTFYEYMITRYLNDDSPEGDLAGDMERESDTFPRCWEDGYDEIYGYLIRHHACLACLAVFEECWEEYAGA